MTEDIILELERKLIQEDIRSSAEKIAEIMADGCLEYCSSGTIYRYKNGETFPLGREPDWEIVDFEAKELATGLMHSTFKLLRNDEVDEDKRVSLRSSIWKLNNEKWQMIFHQGTPARSGY